MFYVGEGGVQPCNFMIVPNLWIPNTQTLYKPVPLSIPNTSVNVPISSGRCFLGRRSRWRLVSLSLVPKKRYPSSSSCFSSCSVVFWFRHFGASWNFTRKSHGECTKQSTNTRFEVRSRENENTFWNKIVIFFSIHNLFWGVDHKIFGDVLCWRRRCSTM